MVKVAELPAGVGVGEAALLNNKPRAATVKCVTDCHFAVLSKEHFQREIGAVEEKKTRLKL